MKRNLRIKAALLSLVMVFTALVGIVAVTPLSVSAATNSQVLTVMSFNVRVDLLKNGRDKLVIDTIKENAPDIFGVQEADITWMNTAQSSTAPICLLLSPAIQDGSLPLLPKNLCIPTPKTAQPTLQTATVL